MERKKGGGRKKTHTHRGKETARQTEGGGERERERASSQSGG